MQSQIPTDSQPNELTDPKSSSQRQPRPRDEAQMSQLTFGQNEDQATPGAMQPADIINPEVMLPATKTSQHLLEPPAACDKQADSDVAMLNGHCSGQETEQASPPSIPHQIPSADDHDLKEDNSSTPSQGDPRLPTTGATHPDESPLIVSPIIHFSSCTASLIRRKVR